MARIECEHDLALSVKMSLEHYRVTYTMTTGQHAAERAISVDYNHYIRFDCDVS
jgi:hypothetical protein